MRVNTNFSLITGQATVGNTAGGTKIADARPGRSKITIVNTGTVATWIGPSGVSASNGVLLPGVVGASITLDTGAPIYGFAASNSVVSFAEVS